jgi:hypothetical protein
MIDYATWCAIREGVASHLTAPNSPPAWAWTSRPSATGSTARMRRGRPSANQQARSLQGAHRRLARCASAHRPAGVSTAAGCWLRGRHQHRQGLCPQDPPAPTRGLPDPGLRSRGSGPGRLGRIRHDRRGQHPAPPFLLRHGAGLEPEDVRRVHSRKRWSNFWRHTSTPLLPWGCRARSWSIICAVRSCACAWRTGAVQSPLSRFRPPLRLRNRRLCAEKRQ